MAKPIFLIGVPVDSHEAEVEKLKHWGFSKLADDYHVLIYRMRDKSPMKFQLFSDKEIEPIELENLKEELELKEKTVMDPLRDSFQDKSVKAPASVIVTDGFSLGKIT